jgi:hypothetical protein
MAEKFSQATLDAIKRAADILHRCALRRDNKRAHAITAFAAEQAEIQNNPAPYQAISGLREYPATIDEFVESEEFLGSHVSVWPELREDLRRMNPDVFTGEAPVYEALLGGATGTGKTMLAQITTLYQLYLCNCFIDPQRVFELAPNTQITFMLMSVTSQVTERAIYRPLRDLFEGMPYAQQELIWSRRKSGILELKDRNVCIVPATANVQAMLGQAVIGGILDEVNFMDVIEHSKRVAGHRGAGGRFDQASELYETLSRRRKSRFITEGISIGTLCVISSTRYKDDFLDRRMRDVEEHGQQNVVVIRRKQYEVNPKFLEGNYPTFRVLVGTDYYPTRILEEHEKRGDHYNENAMVEAVPEPFRIEFQKDPENALRDIIGIATDSISPFISQRHKIIDAITAGEEAGLQHWVENPDVELRTHGMPQWMDEVVRAIRDKNAPRWVHADLSLVSDRCGIAIVKVPGFINKVTKPAVGIIETLPLFHVEAAISIQPDSMHPIDIPDLRRWVLQLSTFYGINIHEFTFDGFQSKESQIQLRKMGVRSREISLDRTTEPYDVLRRALYDDRLIMVNSEIARIELSQLERNTEKNKIDHPPKGSKDVADAIAGAVYAASTSRRIRSRITTVNEDGTRVNVGRNPRDMGPRPVITERPQ